MIRLLFAFLLFCSLCLVQNDLRAQTNVGVRAGINMVSLTHNSSVIDATEHKLTTNFHLGATFDLAFSNKLLLQAEVLYNLKGAKTIDFVGQEAKLNLTYLSFPLLFAYRPQESIRIFIGPEIDYLLKAKIRSEDTAAVDATSFYGDFVVGITLGAAYHMQNRFNIGIRGHYGLTEVQPGDPLWNLRNFYGSLTLGYTL